MTDATSLSVWDVPMPVEAGGTFALKVGAKAASGRGLAGACIEITGPDGAVVASAALGGAPWPGSEALHWTTLDVPAPSRPQIAQYTAHLAAGPEHAQADLRFTVTAAPRPEHVLSVKVAERDTAEALADVEVRLGPFHARTDAQGCARLRVCKGEYRIELWRTAHLAAPRDIAITGDLNLELTMAHVPEEHPDARWVR